MGTLDETAKVPVRPQALMLGFMGLYMRGRHVAVYTGSLIDVFSRVGVSEEAVRSTVARMANRGLLSRHRGGRKVYVGLTDEADALLEDGHRRVAMGAVDQDWDGSWTWVAFSLPDDRRSQRHDLRSRLVWAGFGPLQGGLWIAPGRKDLADVIGDADLDGRVHVLVGTADPTDAYEMIRSAFDVEGIADRYQSFLDRWSGSAVDDDLPDDLARQLLLHNDWLQLIRQDPRLPAQHLPADWPAVPAERLFRQLAAELEPRASAVAASFVESLPV